MQWERVLKAKRGQVKTFFPNLSVHVLPPLNGGTVDATIWGVMLIPLFFS